MDLGSSGATMAHSLGAFYRRSNSATSQVCTPIAEVFGAPPALQRDECILTPPFTPSRWSASDSPQPRNMSQKLDRVLSMFEDFKHEVERDAAETREQLSLIQEDLTDIKAQQVPALKAQKRIPCDVSVSPFNQSIVYLCAPLACSTEGT